MTTVGTGEDVYEPVENWAKLPRAGSFKEIGSVGVDRMTTCYVFNRGEHPMIVFDRDGISCAPGARGCFPGRTGCTWPQMIRSG